MGMVGGVSPPTRRKSALSTPRVSRLHFFAVAGRPPALVVAFPAQLLVVAAKPTSPLPLEPKLKMKMQLKMKRAVHLRYKSVSRALHRRFYGAAPPFFSSQVFPCVHVACDG
jgi:hypothetical protein